MVTLSLAVIVTLSLAVIVTLWLAAVVAGATSSAEPSSPEERRMWILPPTYLQEGVEAVGAWGESCGKGACGAHGVDKQKRILARVAEGGRLCV